MHGQKYVKTFAIIYKTHQTNSNREMISFCFEIRIKHINTVCGKYAVVLNVTPVGAKIKPRNLKF